MTHQEKKLYKALCSFQATAFDESLLDAATPSVLGYLFFNRMQAVAYGTLKKHGLLGKVNREFRNSLCGAYMQNIEKNRSFFQCISYIEETLSALQCQYAMLKGAYLCKCYPEGYRTSNDVDLLVLPKDVTEIGTTLRKAGFKQGHIRNGKFEPATRQEIISSKMMRGETIPYIQEIALPGMPFLEVDINFSLDYKPGDTANLVQILKNTTKVELGDIGIHTLRSDDFFVHLCSHLYKEATTLPWIEMKRDMTMYKYCDIYLLLCDTPKEQVADWFNRAKELGMEKVCAFAVMQMAKLFHFPYGAAVSIAERVLSSDPAFIHTVTDPKNKKEYIFSEKDIETRFFANNRTILLEEVDTK